ncbi:MAG: csiR 1 [Ilumatobacteraceae bacterium]|nr:csiR 1 [Ilumatobacteraceae bacterium]
MPGRTATRTEQVYAQLRADILTGRLTPGARLPFAELSERYGGSMSAIREGLQRLVEQGIVVSEPQMGFRVVTLSVADLQDLTTARCEIEGLALRYAIASGDLGWESEIVASRYALERTPAGSADDAQALSDEWTEAHRRFHQALIAGCPNIRIRGVASALRDAAELYRHWSRHTDHSRDTDAEHQGLVEAVLARDTERATRLLELHLRTTADLLIDRAGFSQPDCRTSPSTGH